MCAAKGFNHERCVVVLKSGCVIDKKIYMSQKKFMKTVITLEASTCISS